MTMFGGLRFYLITGDFRIRRSKANSFQYQAFFNILYYIE